MSYGFHYFKGEKITRDIEVLKSVLKRIEEIDWNDEEIEVSKDWVSVHLFTASQLARFLALRRGHDAELAAVAGALHDIGLLDTEGMGSDHASKGERLSKEILNEVGKFSEEEIKLVVDAVTRHSEKDKVGTWLDEIMKDVDVFDCTMFGSDFSPFEHHYKRVKNIEEELNIKLT